MSSTTLYRASGLALLLGVLLVIVGLPLSFFAFPLDSPLALAMTGVWTAGVVLGQLGGAGIVARQAKQAGWLGFVGETSVGAVLFWLRWKRGGWRRDYA